MLQDLTNGNSLLVQVMAWCRQATTIAWPNGDPDLFGDMASLGRNDLIHPGFKVYAIHIYICKFLPIYN